MRNGLLFKIKKAEKSFTASKIAQVVSNKMYFPF